MNIKKIFFILEEINDQILKNILKFKNISIIYNQEKVNNFDLNKIKLISKKNNIPLYLRNDVKLAIKHDLDGVYISSNNKKIIYPTNKKISFKIIGHAHNQREFFFKKKQFCDIIIVSPIFYNDKYSKNQILDILKFNLLTKDWSNSICALGGINLSNITKIKLTKSKYIGVKKFIENLK
jgi:thiamine monophosphate synthase